MARWGPGSAVYGVLAREPPRLGAAIRGTTPRMSEFVADPSGHGDAAFGLARRDGRTLLVRNPRITQGQKRSFWDLPGGGVLPGERLPDAVVRELHEETGMEAAVGELLLVVDGRKERPDGALLYTWRSFFFEVEMRGTPAAGEGIDDVAWVPDAEVAGRLDAPYHAALRRYLAGEGASWMEAPWVEPAGPAEAGAHLPRRLLTMAAAAAVGDLSLLVREAAAARAEGETPERLAETLLQIVPYAGYPRAISAFGATREILGARTSQNAEAPDRSARGLEVFRAVYGEKADAILAGLEELDPMLARWTIEHAYGRVLAREGRLSLLERELLAVSVLTALGGLDDPLLGHMRAAVRVGASPAQVAAAVQVVPRSVGEGRRDAAKALLARL